MRVYLSLFLEFPLNFTFLLSMIVGIRSMRMVFIPCTHINILYRLIFCRQIESVLSAENPIQTYVNM
jgi:hypothetical protein